ncbi:HEPN domain-containing protein [Pedobacter sp. MC2016-15]|uniref:HEPN domain-containing protein n=1 Tax=Pedobacter sp. MC2016-15 TaxID=2994473 RepID=UPI00224547E7|nr:HEPN domain-containing protein [Pedobacter sp. MC2016-15]MCX2479363.1 HEPN domain-containing protein [Pedobacter sp. MC2016-15]
MKTKFPPSRDVPKNYLSLFLNGLIGKFQPIYIYSFGSKIESFVKAGCFTEHVNQETHHYFLLLITESNTRIDHEVQEYASTHYNFGSITILSHGQIAIKEAINDGSRFFISIYNEGQLLYSHNGLSNFEHIGKVDPEKSVMKAQQYLEHRLSLAEGFLQGARECLVQKKYTIVSFMLHQAVEQCCILLIKVHLGYKSEIHNLLRLLRLCQSFSDRPIKTFLSGSPKDEKLFHLLLKSYSESRYGSSFSITQNDAESLYERVTSFILLTDEMCKAKIEILKAGII